MQDWARRATAIGALLLLAVSPAWAAPAPGHKVVVISVDGLDWRYLRDRDQLGLKIPTFRRLMAEGWTADGVVGVWPTITCGWAEERQRETGDTASPMCPPKKFSQRRTKIAWKDRLPVPSRCRTRAR